MYNLRSLPGRWAPAFVQRSSERPGEVSVASDGRAAQQKPVKSRARRYAKPVLFTAAVVGLALTLGLALGYAHPKTQPKTQPLPNLNSTGSVTVSVPATVPSDASPEISPNFPAFAFEASSFLLYAGAPGSVNTFSQNLIQSITSRTNQVPIIRVGGTSLDDAKYIPTQAQALSFPSSETGNVPKNVTIGPTYFQSFPNFPSAEYILCLPLAANNLTNTLEFVKAGYPMLKDQLLALEIGNEPNLYPGNVRTFNYSPKDYVKQFTQYTNSVDLALGLSNTSAIYDACTISSPRNFSTSNGPATVTLWYPTNLFADGLAALSGRIGSVSMHYYQTKHHTGVPGATQLQNALLNHTVTVIKMSFYKPIITYLATNYPTVRLNLAEAASSLNGATADYTLETTFGATLWQADWLLYSMSIGINRVNWQQIADSAFDLWQPILYKGHAPAVLPPFYAMLFAADFIGTDGPPRVSNIDLLSDTLTAYAAYVGADPVRVALVNMQYFAGTESASNPRATESFVLHLPVAVSSVTVRYLRADAGATASRGFQITWEGMEWTVDSNGVAQQVVEDTTTLAVVAGRVTVLVRASEAVIVDLRS